MISLPSVTMPPKFKPETLGILQFATNVGKISQLTYKRWHQKACKLTVVNISWTWQYESQEWTCTCNAETMPIMLTIITTMTSDKDHVEEEDNNYTSNIVCHQGLTCITIQGTWILHTPVSKATINHATKLHATGIIPVSGKWLAFATFLARAGARVACHNPKTKIAVHLNLPAANPISAQRHL